MTIKKRHKKFIITLLLIVLGYLGIAASIFFCALRVNTASADTVSTSPYCLTYGRTTVDGTTTSGPPDNFKVYMKAARSSGSETIYNGHLSNWSYYYVIIDAVNVSDHLSLELYRNGSLYKEQSVSGEDDITVNFGTLPSGDYTLRYECRYAKNIFHAYKYYTYEYNFEVDITDPTYSISSGTGTSSYCTNKNIYYSAYDEHFSHIRYRRGSESTYSIYYGTSYSIAATEANNDYWYFYAMDTLGNQSAISFRRIDTIAPVGTVTNQDEDVIANGSATNEQFIYSATDVMGVEYIQYKSPSVTNWTDYPENVSILKSDGWYYFRAIDAAGNVSDEYRVYYDTTKPIGAVFDSVQARGSGYITNNSYVKYVASDAGSGVGTVYVRKPGSSAFTTYTNGSQLTTEGKYYFKAYDKAGNVTTTTHEITLDKTAPVGQLKANGVNVSNNSYTSKSFSYSATDAVGVAILQMKRPNSTSWETYTAGTAITGAEGWYAFRATDLAGNVSGDSNIFYDKSKPTVTLIGANIGASGTMLTNGTVAGTECIRATAIDTGSGIASMRVWGDNYSSAVSYVAGTELTKEGRYYFDATNKAGITSDTYRIVLDKTAPNGLVYANGINVANGTITNADKIMYIANDALAGVESWFVKKPNTNEFVAYTPAAGLTEEGQYEFYSVDYAGNQSAISTITIDRSIPTAQLYADGATITNGSYTNKQYIKFVSNGTCYVKKPGETSYSSYVSGTEFYQVGRYEFYAQNAAGTKTDTYVVIIDRTPKTVTNNSVSSGKNWIDWELTWTDGDAATTAPITRITINGKNYAFGSIVHTLAGKEYNVVVYDAAGNQSTKKFWGGIIDLPAITMQKQYWEVKDARSHKVYSFSRQESALGYAIMIEQYFVTYKTWSTETWDQGIPMDTKDSVNAKNGNYYVYKSEDDPEKQVAYFTQARLDEVVKKYAEKTIQHWYYWQKEPESCLDGDLNAYPNEKKIVATEVELREGLIYTLDGVGYTDLTITEPGEHTLLIEDGYGNSVEYEIYILNSAPTMEYALGENSPSKAEFDRTYYFKDRVTVSIPFEGDEFAMFEVVNADTGESLGCFDIANACYIEESGSYTAVAYNHYGESETFSFVISMNAPTITLTGNAEKKTLDVLITESVDKESNITFLEIAKSDDNGETWIALTEDDYGKEITIETLEYRFRTSGLYKVTVMDEFRTGIDAITQTLEYKQPIPVGVLAGVEDKGYTNKAVTFTWTDDALVSLMKDGVAVEYKSGQKLTANGSYVLSFSNYDGYTKTYTFVIDTVAPMVTLEGAKSGEFVNAGVKAHFANDETAEIFKDGKLLGSYLGGSNIQEDGVYRIVVKDKALNETAVTFTIDTTVDWSININEKGLSNSVMITAGEDVEVILTKDGAVVEYTLGEAITEIGEYSLEIIDSLGNTESRNFSIVAPIVREFTHNFDDVPGFEKVLVNGEEKRLNYGTLELFADGLYEVGVVANGETYTFTVTVDSTLPTITLNGVENGGATNGNVTIATTEETAKLTVYFKGEEIAYTAGDELMAEGEYRATATDLAGNSIEVTFSIDKTAPVLTLVGVENGGVTNGSVSVQVNDGTLIVYLNDTEIEYAPSEELTKEGSYFVQACDSVGNVSEVMFTIDKTGPVLTLNGVEKDGKTNRNVIVDATNDTLTLKVYLNGEEINYEQGNELKAEGAYLVTAVDALGNITEISFTIDKTAPTIILNGVENKGATRKAVSLGEISEEAAVTVYFNDEEITYEEGDSLTKVGKYRVVVTDSSNNASEYTFTIEKKVSNGEIALIVIGGLGIVGGIVFFILKKRKII